jgi:hypothetical protein
MIRLVRITQILALTACCGWGLAQAQGVQAEGQRGRGPIDQNWQFSLGTFLVTSDTKLKVNGESVGEEGTDVNWENEFDLGDKDQFRFDAFWRFAERHKLRVMWFENNRNGSRTLTRDVEFQGELFPVTTTVSAGLDEQIIELAYEYAFYKTDKLEISGSGGIHALKFSASLSGTVSTAGGGAETRAASSDVTGPLPVIGFRVLWDMGHNFYLDGLAQVFYISFDNFDGSISDVKLTGTWMPWRNFGIGLGYNHFRTRVDVGKNDFDGRLTFTYRGAMAFATFAF